MNKIKIFLVENYWTTKLNKKTTVCKFKRKTTRQSTRILHFWKDKTFINIVGVKANQWHENEKWIMC